jgi:hypothetical protein
MTPQKTPQEIEIYNRYKKWLYSDYIPQHIVDNYKTELNAVKKKLSLI